MSYELRILTGLHRGATLPLDDHPHVIGASDDADVVLVDPDIAAHHATLSRTDSGWLMSAADGVILSADNNQPQTLIDLAVGDFVRLGKVWASIVAEDARWQNPPPEPVDEPFDADVFNDDRIDDTVIAEDSFREEPVFASVDSMEQFASESADANQQTHGAPRRQKKWRMVYVPLAMAAVLSAAAAYAMTSKSATPNALKNPLKDIDLHAEFSKSASAFKQESDKEFAATPEATTPSATTKPTLMPEQLRNAFRKRLSDAELLNRFDLALDDESWSMKASLDDEDATRFGRILKSFMTEYNIAFPVNAKIVSAEGMLPFKIRQVISGANASVVTNDGARLYVGDEYRGVRMVAIQDSRLVFAGKRKIEVNW